MALPAGFVVSQLHRPEEQDSENTEEDSEETRDKTEVNEALKWVKAEIIEGDKGDSTWLVVNDVQICHKSEEELTADSVFITPRPPTPNFLPPCYRKSKKYKNVGVFIL